MKTWTWTSNISHECYLEYRILHPEAKFKLGAPRKLGPHSREDLLRMGIFGVYQQT